MSNMIFILAAAGLLADGQVVRPVIISPLPPPQPVMVDPVAPPEAVAEVGAGKLGVKLLPDLVVDQARVEDDRTAHFRVTNVGTADAVGSFRVTADAYIDGRKGEPPYGSAYWIENLAMGESKWVKVTGFGPLSEPYYAGKDYSFPLGKATVLAARVDPPVIGSGFLGGGDPSRTFQEMFGGTKSAQKCDGTSGCIKETDETNNYFKAEGEAIGRGAP